MAPPGANTAESLLNSAYFCKGKLFGLRTGEHRLMRLSDIAVFDEFRCKTFKVRLKDLKNKPRLYWTHLSRTRGKPQPLPCFNVFTLHSEN